MYAKKNDHKEQSKRAILFSHQKLCERALILLGVMSSTGSGYCTYGEQLGDEGYQNRTLSYFPYDQRESLFCHTPTFGFEDNDIQALTNEQFFSGFDDGLDFQNELAHFESTRQHTARDAITAPDEDQLSFAELIERYDQESVLESALMFSREYSSPREKKKPKHSLQAEETIECMEKVIKGDVDAGNSQNINKTVKIEQEDLGNQLQLVRQPENSGDALPERAGVVHFTTYFTAQPISIRYRFALQEQEGVLTKNITLEMSQQQASTYVNNWCSLALENPAAGGLGFTISKGRISAIRMYNHDMS